MQFQHSARLPFGTSSSLAVVLETQKLQTSDRPRITGDGAVSLLGPSVGDALGMPP